MRVILIPRMNRIAVDTVLDMKEAGEQLGSIRDRLKSMPNAASIGETGGRRATEDQLRSLANEIGALAKSNGFPDLRNENKRAQFDSEVAVLFGRTPMLHSGEALRDDVWAFLSTWLLQDFTEWRFGLTRARYHGGVRNAFQRLWLRSNVLDRGEGQSDRWFLVKNLTEDACVQILERPSIGGDKLLALALAEGWIRCSEKFGRSAMEPVMRRATIGVRIRNEVVALTAMPASDLASVIDDEFDRAARAFRKA